MYIRLVWFLFYVLSGFTKEPVQSKIRSYKNIACMFYVKLIIYMEKWGVVAVLRYTAWCCQMTASTRVAPFTNMV